MVIGIKWERGGDGRFIFYFILEIYLWVMHTAI